MSNRITPIDQGSLGKIGDTDPSIRGGDDAKPTSSEDTVNLTNRAQLLERLEKTLASLPEIDNARVEAVKAQIENGEYQIDSEKIAEALLRADQELDG